MGNPRVLVIGPRTSLSGPGPGLGVDVVLCTSQPAAERHIEREAFDAFVGYQQTHGAVAFLAEQRRSHPEIVRLLIVPDDLGAAGVAAAVNRVLPAVLLTGAPAWDRLAGAVHATLDDPLGLPRRQRERLLLEATDRADIGVWSYDVRERVMHLLDERMQRLFGLPSEVANVDALPRLVEPADLDRIDEEIAVALSEGRPVRTRISLTTPAGERRTVELRGTTVLEGGAPRWFVGVDIDVTDIHARELEYESVAADQAMALEVAAVGTWSSEPERRVFRCDERCQQMMRFPIREGAELLDLWSRGLHVDDREQAIRSFETAIRDHCTYAAEFRYHWPDGSIRHLFATGEPRLQPDGTTALHGVVVDRTEAKLAAARQRGAEERLAVAAELGGLGVWEFDLESRRAVLDRRAQELVGADEELVSVGWLNARLSPAYRRDVARAITRARRTGRIDLRAEFVRDDRTAAMLQIRGVADIGHGSPVVRGLASIIPEPRGEIVPPRPGHDRGALPGHLDSMVSGAADWRRLALGVLNSLPSQIVVLDPDGEVVLANHAWVEHVRMFRDRGTAAARFRDFYRGVQAPDDGEISRRIDDLLAGRRNSLFFDYPAGDPEHDAWFNLRGSRFEAADGPRIVLEHVEITQRLRALRALGAASVEAREASKAKSRFIAGVSHEIRTPLNAILGHAELLQREHELGPEIASQLDAIHRSGEHLLELISGVLELSSAENGSLDETRARFDPADLLRDVVAVFGARAEAKGIALSTRCIRPRSELLCADIGKVRQIAINLVDNAVKFTDEGAIEVDVEVADGPALRRSLVVEVRDSGPGLPEESLQQLFEPFRSLPVGGRETEGAGLGLAISREYSRALGGRLTASNHDAGGAAFRLELEVSLASEDDHVQLRREPIRLAEGVAGKRLLIVDDNQDNLVVLARMLEPVGFNVYPATSGQEAIDVIQEIRPDAVLLDLRMPGVDGWHTARTILAIEPSTLIIAVSASVSPDVRKRALDAGACAFVGKPYRRLGLLELLGELLDIEYEYAAPTAVLLAAPAGPVSEIDPEIRQGLYEAAAAGDMQRLEDLVATVGERQGDLARYLRGLVDGFEIETLLALTAPPSPPADAG